MAALDDLIQQIRALELRDRIQKEADRLLKQKKFGLVFEDHLPECTPLYGMPIKRKFQVALKPAPKDNLGKAKAFAKYTEENIGLGRFQLIRKKSNTIKNKHFKRLDFSKGVVHQKVLAAINTDEIDHIFDEHGFFG